MKRQRNESSEVWPRMTRRAVLLGTAQVGLMGVLGWRMKALQIDQADQFALLAEENRVNMRLIPPSRGLIFDRNGIPLATNEPVYRIVIVREAAGEPEEALARLSRVMVLDPEDIQGSLEEMERVASFVPVTVKDRVTWDDVARVTANAPALPGITAEVGLSRNYPAGPDTAHIVGYVGPVSDYDLSLMEDPDPLFQIPKFQFGKTGVEAKYEEQLRGKAGAQRIEVNSLGRVMREISREEGIPGTDLQLTIDADLQAYVEARMEGESAACVVIDCASGDLLAVGNAPSFDPNLFVRGISVPDWTALNENKYRPLSAKAVQGAYPPGSTFKIVTGLAALEAGVIAPEETVYCAGVTDISGIKFHCWKKGGHGNVDYNDSLKYSCDCYYYEVGQRVGIDAISAMAKKLGVGVRPDIPMSAVAEGIAPDGAWKLALFNDVWRVGDTVNASIGQGYVLATPLQLAVMTARVATGREVMPRLVKSIDGVEQPSGAGGPLGINENSLRRARASMFDVVNHARGTAHRSQIMTPGMEMAGKTGTSQVRRITPEERARGVTSNADLPWERRDHALWVDFAPYDNPRVAVCVVVEHGSGGSTAAAPIGRDVTLQALYNGFPPLDAYPSDQRETAGEMQARVRALLAGRSRPTLQRA
ncbi:Penicillin-binding protein 2 (PBP-2) [Rubellimicrobium mesophilum DSM 19309]|uniref:Penicillin-binding protein 2 (PBP-2) n=1 Tax=Rubellimicrobium mesophilum DSM 19309 TaxID=442562 RepID=A0A017HCU6_9RHOB|nr:penicillin-binding protein 2 [Rubellimicrobium mesophilum]EYD72115.1 Penicillin-binding protein 2 (PBP-2) [Rubellimicrobium mesophilum DSM 19309]